MSKHTPTPWAIRKCPCGHPSCDAYEITAQSWRSEGRMSKDDAELICRAVNSHDALVEALKQAANELNAIRARDGAPQHIDWHRGQPLQTSSCTHEYWDALTEECFAALRAAGVEP